jgi:hypothetical protein
VSLRSSTSLTEVEATGTSHWRGEVNVQPRLILRTIEDDGNTCVTVVVGFMAIAGSQSGATVLWTTIGLSGDDRRSRHAARSRASYRI